LGYSDAELSIVIVDDEEMARLNRQYRQVDSTTDVLSFPMLEGEDGGLIPQLLGDVVISAPTADSMRRQHHCSRAAVLDLLLVHGILHLAGFDHERGKQDAVSMREKSLELLVGLGRRRKDYEWFVENLVE
jgi:probable rRNA maturation factor